MNFDSTVPAHDLPPRALACALVLALGSGCASPTAPDTRTGFIALRVVCDRFGSDPLLCRAETYCSGSYRCPDPAADGRDVTATTSWTVDDARVVRVTGPGRIAAEAVGDTVIRARLPDAVTDAYQTVSVFPGSPPLPTNEIFGSVWEAGKTPSAGYVSGAVVEVLDGIIAGRKATSGVPPPLLPGYLGPFGGPGYYRILGAPPGTFTLRISASGFASQTRVVQVPARGSPLADFQLVHE